MPFPVIERYFNSTAWTIRLKRRIFINRKAYGFAVLVRLLSGKIRKPWNIKLTRRLFPDFLCRINIPSKLRRNTSARIIAYELNKPYHVVIKLCISKHRLCRRGVQLVCKALIHIWYDINQNCEIRTFVDLICEPAVFGQLACNQLLHRISRKPQKIYITVSHISNSLRLLLIYLPLTPKNKKPANKAGIWQNTYSP